MQPDSSDKISIRKTSNTMTKTTTSKARKRSKSPSWDELREMMRNTQKFIDQTNLQMQETDRRMKETDQLIKETSKIVKETSRQMKETDRQMKETDRKFKELSNQFSSTTGHIIEGLMEPAAIRLFREKGYNINRCWKNFKRYEKASGRKLEVDLLLLDDDIAIIVEVKTNCTRRDIDHFTDQMAFFKEVCPEYADKTILLAVAAINYDRDAKQHALQEGLLAITASDNEIFSLECPDESRLKKL